MYKFTLSRPVFENLLMHIVNIEHDKNNLVDEYFPEKTKERHMFKNMLDNYIEKIDFLIRNHLNISENADNKLPFVVINSAVDILDMDANDVFCCRIVTPENNKDTGDVSIFSPLGKSLLLKKVGDEVMVKTPAGKRKYKIQSIRLDI